jgi:hypothetical protein
MDLYELLRWANLAMSVGLFATCMMRVFRDWHGWTHRERVVRVHLSAYLFLLGYGTIEALADGVEPGLRIPLLLLVHASFALALWRTRHDPVR